ncbi:MAG: TetR/AcrR family transcriptional regulator [Myxococcales bacterium]|nr:TetR/AcrR family transcriptional regulator [Myxococcales bacterium]
MGRPVLSDEQVEDFRQRVCEVSMQLFVEHGYEGFTLRALAKELGCSHATPYRYFAGKPEIFASVRAEGFRRFAAFLRDRLEGVDDPLARVRTLAQGYFDFSVEQAAPFTIIFEMGQPHPSEYPFVGEAGSDAWSVLFETVRAAVEAGALEGEPNELAHTMWAGIHGVSTLHLARKLSMGRSADALLQSMTDALIRAHEPREP